MGTRRKTLSLVCCERFLNREETKTSPKQDALDLQHCILFIKQNRWLVSGQAVAGYIPVTLAWESKEIKIKS